MYQEKKRTYDMKSHGLQMKLKSVLVKGIMHIIDEKDIRRLYFTKFLKHAGKFRSNICTRRKWRDIQSLEIVNV